jgi:hypothetical protein
MKRTDARDDKQIHASVLLRQLIAEAPEGHFTLEWLTKHLPKHSFGCILLFLAVIALLPVISVPARLLIIFLGGQIILGYHTPVLPKKWMKRPLPTKYLAQLQKHAVPMLSRLEYYVRPRWGVMFHGTRRLTAVIAVLVTALSLPAPIPLANMPPAMIGILMALSHIEHDGLVLFISLMCAIGLLAIVAIGLIEPFI